MTLTPPFLPRAPHRVLLVALPDVELLDVSGPLAVFDVANRVLESVGRPAFYGLEVAAPSSRVRSASGLTLCATPLAKARPAKTLIIGGKFALIETPLPPGQLRQIGRLAKQAARRVSICAGAFVLGDLGLLDGRRCTTHWLGLPRLRERFPKAKVERDAIYTDEHPVYTSAGVTCGIDLALHLVEKDLGSKLSLQVARLLVVFLNRPGGQSQFSAALEPTRGAEPSLRRLIASIAERPGADHGVDALARRVAMSPRNFARVFRRQTGQTPGALVERLRVDAARRRLEMSDDTHARVASDCGFGTEETLRRVFQRALKVSPQDYRLRFRRRPA